MMARLLPAAFLLGSLLPGCSSAPPPSREAYYLRVFRPVVASYNDYQPQHATLQRLMQRWDPDAIPALIGLIRVRYHHSMKGGEFGLRLQGWAAVLMGNHRIEEAVPDMIELYERVKTPEAGYELRTAFKKITGIDANEGEHEENIARLRAWCEERNEADETTAPTPEPEAAPAP